MAKLLFELALRAGVRPFGRSTPGTKARILIGRSRPGDASYPRISGPARLGSCALAHITAPYSRYCIANQPCIRRDRPPGTASWSHETHGRVMPALVRDRSSPTRHLRTRSGPSSTRKRPFGAAASVCFAGRLPAAAASPTASTAPSLGSRGEDRTPEMLRQRPDNVAPKPRRCPAKTPVMLRATRR
jgi:hypothetical protein